MLEGDSFKHIYFLLISTDTSLVDGDEPAAPVVRGNNIAAVSSISLCTDVRY